MANLTILTSADLLYTFYQLCFTIETTGWQEKRHRERERERERELANKSNIISAGLSDHRDGVCMATHSLHTVVVQCLWLM